MGAGRRWAGGWLVLALALGPGCHHEKQHEPPLPDAPPVVQPQPTPIEPTQFGAATFVELAKRVSPSVVNIDITKRIEAVPGLLGPLFGVGPHTLTERGVGSGFIVEPDGLIVTNNHVIAGKPEIVVTLQDGRSFRGKVLGSDALTDVALVKIDGHDLPALKLGDSDKLAVGQWVMAFGSPLGLSRTVTKGIISSLNREISINERVSFIQTDAAINPGNSGGPLVDLGGQAIGMNTAIAEGATGIGFAIPSSTIRYVVDQLLKYGHVTRAWLGVAVQAVPPEQGGQLGPEAHGVMVFDVVKGGPAAKAGIERGDVIEALNGEPLRDPAELVDKVSRSPVGSTVRLRIDRKGKQRTVEVTLEQMPTNEGAPSKQPKPRKHRW